jgi:hypothetical protein
MALVGGIGTAWSVDVTIIPSDKSQSPITPPLRRRAQQAA